MTEPTTDSQTGRRARRKVETRRRIIEAALDLFHQQSYLQTTIDQIAEAADVGKGTFFNYFPSKEQVLTEAVGLKLGIVPPDTVAKDFEGRTVRERLKEVCMSGVTVPRGSESITRNAIVAHLATEAAWRKWGENLEGERRLLGEWVAIAQERGETQADLDTEEIARLLIKSILGAVVLWSTQSDGDLSKWIETSFDRFWEGILEHRPPEEPQTPQPTFPTPRHVPDAFPWMK